MCQYDNAEDLKDLYHYCSLDVCQKIIENKEIWLSEATTTNDSTELLWFADNIKEVLMDCFEKQSEQFKKKYSTVFPKLVERQYDEFFSQKPYYHMFISCFSTNGDLLSQWRGYTPDGGNGISVGFKKDALLDLLQNQNCVPALIEIGFVNYDKEKQNSRKYISNLANDQLFPLLDKIDKSDLSNFGTRSLAEFEKIFKTMFSNAVLVKSPFFAEESEVRLFSWQTLDFNGGNLSEKINLSSIQYRTRGNLVVPYIKLNFSTYGNLSDLIQEVIIGPKCQANDLFIQSLLKRNGFKNTLVKKSNGFMYR